MSELVALKLLVVVAFAIEDVSILSRFNEMTDLFSLEPILVDKLLASLLLLVELTLKQQAMREAVLL